MLVVLLLTIPLVGLCLPIFIVGARQSDEEQLDFICLLYPLNRLASSSSAASALLRSLNATYVNSPVLQAWVAWAAAEVRKSNSFMRAWCVRGYVSCMRVRRGGACTGCAMGQ